MRDLIVTSPLRKLEGIKLGDYIVFYPGNTMQYLQDPGILMQGIPSGPYFKIKSVRGKPGELMNIKVELVTRGYGIKEIEKGYEYGNGALIVSAYEFLREISSWDMVTARAKPCKERISREKLFMEITKLVSQRGTCSRKQVGAVATIEGRIIATGYNGVPSGQPHCCETEPEIGSNQGCVKCVHAESNLVSWSAREGIKLKGATLYCTLSPCTDCSKLLINSGIIEVIYLEKYRDTSGVDLLNKAGIKTYQYKEEKDD